MANGFMFPDQQMTPFMQAMTSPGMGMAMEAANNFQRMAQGQQVTNPVARYQQMVMERAQQNQAQRLNDLRMQQAQQELENPAMGRGASPRAFAPTRGTIGGRQVNLTPVFNPATQQVQMVETEMPEGFEPQSGVDRIDGGDRWILLSSVTGEKVGEIPKEYGPGESPEDKAAAAQQQAFAKNKETFQNAFPKLVSKVQSAEAKNSVVDKTIDEIVPLLNQWTTEYGAALSGLPGSEARILKNKLDTIKANVGFQELQDMRDSSPSGGALGNVTELELGLLQAVLGSLDQATTAPELLNTLSNIRASRNSAIERLKRATNMERERFELDPWEWESGALQFPQLGDETITIEVD